MPWIKVNTMIDKSKRWVEPFLGSGVVGFNMGVKNALFCDSNPHIINFYNQLKSKEITASKVKFFLQTEGQHLSEKGQEYYYYVRERFNAEQNPLDFLFLNRSCFNGMIRFNRKFLFNVPYGHKPNRFSKSYITKIYNQVKYVETAIEMNNWIFKCQDFTDTLKEAAENDFIYCDPPYINRHVDYYDSWNENDEFNLHYLLINSGAKFMLSTWDYNKYRKNAYLDTVWSDCNKINKEHFYHIGGLSIEFFIKVSTI